MIILWSPNILESTVIKSLSIQLFGQNDDISWDGTSCAEASGQNNDDWPEFSLHTEPLLLIIIVTNSSHLTVIHCLSIINSEFSLKITVNWFTGLCWMPRFLPTTHSRWMHNGLFCWKLRQKLKKLRFHQRWCCIENCSAFLWHHVLNACKEEVGIWYDESLLHVVRNIPFYSESWSRL